MFWRLGFHHRSPIENLLDKTDPQLEELLDEEDIIQECKSASDKLSDFLSRPDIISKMIEFVTVDVPNSTDEKRRLKYPFLSCEILCCDISTLLDKFCENPQLWRQLFAFLDNPPPLNPVLSAYFIKFVSTLLQKKTHEVMEYVQSCGDKMVINLTTHIGTYGIGDLILRFMGCDMMDSSSDPFGGSLGMSITNQLRLKMFENKTKGRENKLDAEKIAQWWLDNRVIELLVEKLDPDYDSEVHANTCNVLADVIRKFSSPQPTLLSDKLKSEETIREILNYILRNPHSSVLLEGLSLLSAIVQSVSTQLGIGSKTDTTPRQVEVIMERIQDFVTLLQQPPQLAPIENTMGEVVDPPLGFTRLKIVGFLASLFHTKYLSVEKDLMDKNVLGSLLDLFFSYPNNNMLHHQVEQVVSDILSGPSDEMKLALFKECKLIERIIEAYKLNEKEISQPKGMRRGNMGHITLISNNIARSVNTQQIIADVVNEISEWKEFETTYLNDINKLESNTLGGPTPLSKSLEDDIFEYPNSWSNNANEEEENQDFDDELDKHHKDESDQRDPEFDARHVFEEVDDVKMEEDFDDWADKQGEASEFNTSQATLSEETAQQKELAQEEQHQGPDWANFDNTTENVTHDKAQE